MVDDANEPRRAELDLPVLENGLAEGYEADRLLLAAVLHDDVVQHLVGIRYLLHSHRREVAQGLVQGNPSVSGLLDNLHVLENETLVIMHRVQALISELRPPALHDYGLAAALDRFVAQLLREHSGAAPAVTLALEHSTLHLSALAASCLFRVAQAGLREVLGHQEVTRVTLSLWLDERWGTLQLTHDGGDLRPGTSGQVPLTSVWERVAAAAGEWPGAEGTRGETTLVARIPIRSNGPQSREPRA